MQVHEHHVIAARFEFYLLTRLHPNGKIDRSALAELASPGTEVGTEYVPPSTDTQFLLADIWAGAS